MIIWYLYFLVVANLKNNIVPIIDLTSNDDPQTEQHQLDKNETDTETAQMSNKHIELNRTPPIDANGNEILITTDTKTMQSISFKKRRPNSSELQNLLTNNNSYSEKLENSKTTSIQQLKLQRENCNTTCANSRYKGIRIPPKKQIKLMAKYGRWQRQLRTYNGFRLFAYRNHACAERHVSESKTESTVNNILLKWWNSISINEKEHYAQVAEIIYENRLRSNLNVEQTQNKQQQQNDLQQPISDFNKNNNTNESAIEKV